MFRLKKKRNINNNKKERVFRFGVGFGDFEKAEGGVGKELENLGGWWSGRVLSGRSEI